MECRRCANSDDPDEDAVPICETCGLCEDCHDHTRSCGERTDMPITLRDLCKSEVLVRRARSHAATIEAKLKDALCMVESEVARHDALVERYRTGEA